MPPALVEYCYLGLEEIFNAVAHGFFVITMAFWKQCIIGSFVVTGIEFVSGCIVNLWLGWNVWDYSNMPLNLLGQICLPFSLLWVLVSGIAVILDDHLRYWLFGEEKPHYKLF